MRSLVLVLMSALIHGAPGCAIAATGTDGKPSVTTLSNYIKNPSADKNLLYINYYLGSASITRDTSAGYRLDGGASIKVPSFSVSVGLTGSIDHDLYPLSDSVTSKSKMCEFKGQIKGDASKWYAKIFDGATEVKSLKLSNVPDWTKFSVITGCVANPKIYFESDSESGGSSGSFNYGDLSYNEAEKVTVGDVNNTFTAKVSAAGVVSDRTGPYIDWIDSASISDTSLYALDLKGFNNPPTCTSSVVSTSTGAAWRATVANTTASQLQIRVGYTTDTANFTKSANNFNISCTRTGSDYIKDAKIADIYLGRNVRLIASKTSSQPVTANTTDISFTSLIDDAGGWSGTTYTAKSAGDYRAVITTVSAAYTVLDVYKNGSFFGIIAPILPTPGGAFIGSGSLYIPDVKFGDTISIRSQVSTGVGGGNATLSIVKENSNTAAMQPNDAGKRIEWAVIYGTGSNEACVSTPCLIKGESTPGWIAATRSAAGVYHLTFPGSWNKAKISGCIASPNSQSSVGGFPSVSPSSGVGGNKNGFLMTSNFAIGSFTDGSVFITCYGSW